MSLTSALSIASSGLNGVQYALTVASQNVSNANTSGYVRESASLVAVEGQGVGSGVRAGLTLRASDPGLQKQVWAQSATVAGLQTTDNALGAIDSLLGTTSADTGTASKGSGTLSDLLGSVQAAFVTLSSDPSGAAAQQGVLSAAKLFTTRVNGLSGAYQAQRQTAQDTIADGVQAAASDLSTIGALSDRIVLLKAQGSDTADLENQRDAAMSDLAQFVSVQFQQTPTGDMLVRTASGLSLPTRGTATLSTPAGATIDLQNAYPGTIAPITLGGRDVTSLLTGGKIGAALTLRDTTLPTMQAQLDSLSGAVANRFDAAGLDLFSTASGTLPGASGSEPAPAGQLGFSAQISVNPAVIADPSKLRDGTSGAATTGTADDQTVIDAVLNTTFGTSGASATSSGLGVGGSLSTGYSGSGSLTALASSLGASQGSVISSASSQLTTEQAVQTKLDTSLSSAVGVNVDDEMASIVSLQNSYAANAKVISAVQSMFQSLLAAVQ